MADDPIRFALLIGLLIAMLQLHSIKSNISNMTKNIVKTIPKPKCISNSYIVNVIADDPIHFTLLIELLIAILRLYSIKSDISNITKNIIRNSEGLKKDLIELAL